MLTTSSEQTDSLLGGISGVQDLETFWQKVLERLRPPAAQVLLRQHGKLLSCRSSCVEVALRSPALVELAQRHTQQIALAFKQVLGYVVEVNIQPISDKDSKGTHTLEQYEANAEKDRVEVLAAAQSLAAYFEGAIAAFLVID